MTSLDMGQVLPKNPSDGAFALLSKSFLDVQRNAENDVKLIKARAQSIQRLATSIQEWDNIKLPLTNGKDVTAGTLIRRIKNKGDELKSSLPLEDMDVFKSLQQHISEPGLRKINSSPDFSRLTGPKLIGNLQPFGGKGMINLNEWNMAASRKKWDMLVTEGLEPIRRVQETIKEMEQSSTGANPAEMLEKFKKSMTIECTPVVSTPCEKSESSFVPPLDVPELLETLVRQSEPLLTSLGVKPDVPDKLCSLIRSCTSSTSQSLETTSEDPGSVAISALERRLDSVMQSTGYKHRDAIEASTGLLGKRSSKQRSRAHNIAIFTTASLPWMTGTSVNPLLRAAYLAKMAEEQQQQQAGESGGTVTLLVPWLSQADQKLVYPSGITFDTPAEQETYVRNWLKARVGFAPGFKLSFYPGKFSQEKRSILAVGDISSLVPDSEADIAVLEEPEHLTWYYHGQRWTDKFRHVVGIVHTNYLEYVKREKNGAVQSFLLEHVNNWMARSYCHKVVRLSGATQDFPRSIICNVHGVGVKFLEIGQRVAEMQRRASSPPSASLSSSASLPSSGSPFSKGAYFLGKMLWGKGYRELVDLMHTNQAKLDALNVDVFGSGEDFDAVKSEAEQKRLRIQFHKGRDHADPSLHDYKVFINPSISDVVCTTTAEALAMGKLVVCADHPSNDFFRSFPNCLIYKTPEEFVQKVEQAMSSEPQPLSDEQRYMLTWEAATTRFLEVSDLKSVLENQQQPAALLNSPQGPFKSPQSSGTLRASRSCEDLQIAESIDSAHMESADASTGEAQSLSTISEQSSENQVPKWLPPLGVPPAVSSSRASAPALLKSTLSLSLSAPDLSGLVDRGLAFSHFMASGVEAARIAAGAAPDSMHVPEDMSKELGLPPPWVQRPTYGW